MTTATSPFCSCGAVAGGTSAAFGARAGGLSDYDLDRYRHALTQRGICIGDHDPQTIDQIRAPIGRFYRFGRELDRKSVGEGKRVSVRVDTGGRRLIKKKRHMTKKRL